MNHHQENLPHNLQKSSFGTNSKMSDGVFPRAGQTCRRPMSCSCYSDGIAYECRLTAREAILATALLSLKHVSEVVFLINPSNLEATFIQSTRMQRFLLPTTSCSHYSVGIASSWRLTARETIQATAFQSLKHVSGVGFPIKKGKRNWILKGQL